MSTFGFFAKKQTTKVSQRGVHDSSFRETAGPTPSSRFLSENIQLRGRLTLETIGVVTEDGSMEKKLTSSPNNNRDLTSATVDSIVAEGKVDVKEILEIFIFFSKKIIDALQRSIIYGG